MEDSDLWVATLKNIAEEILQIVLGKRVFFFFGVHSVVLYRLPLSAWFYTAF